MDDCNETQVETHVYCIESKAGPGFWENPEYLGYRCSSSDLRISWGGKGRG